MLNVSAKYAFVKAKRYNCASGYENLIKGTVNLNMNSPT